MKILRLHLLAFGPFTDKVLDFSDGCEGLHMVYGPNEAGKTSALNALRQLLYGFPQRSADNFIHPNPKLRIGGILRHSDGRLLDVIRRKGRIHTLRAADDAEIIDESRMKNFLGGVDADMFATMFGIDHGALVRGGEEIIQGGGDIGQVLFAAGSGISDLRRVQSELQLEAEALFKPAGQKPRINETVADFKKTQKAIRDSQLSEQRWQQHDAALRDALARKQTVETELNARQRERQRLTRIKEGLPAIGKRKEWLGELQALADVVILPADFSERRRELITRLKTAENEKSGALERLSEIKASLEKIEIPEALLARADAIEVLYQEHGSHRKAHADRARLEIQCKGLQAEAEAVLKELGSDLTLENVDQLRLEKTQTIRIQELAAVYERLTVRSESTREETAKLKRRIETLHQEWGAIEVLPDPTSLRRALERALQQGDLEQRYQSLRAEIESKEKGLQSAINSQTFWHGKSADIENLPIPSLESIEVFEQRLNHAETKTTRYQDEIEKIERRMLEIDGQIRQLKLERDVPSEEELQQARRRRDQGWRLVVEAWRNGIRPEEAPPGSFAASADGAGLAEAYAKSVRQVDEIADRLRRESDRVAKQAALLADRQMQQQLLERLQGQLRATDEALKTVRAEWKTRWQPIAISPGSPREMRAWAVRMTAVAEKVAALREQNAQTDHLKTAIDGHRRELIENLRPFGCETETANRSLTHLIEKVREIIDQSETVRSFHTRLQHELNQQETELRDMQSRLSAIETDLADWRLQWTEAIRPLGLDSHTTPAQANAVLQDLNTLFAKLKEAEGYRRRIFGIDRDAEAFTQKTRELVDAVAPDLTTLSAEQAAYELNVRLAGGRLAATQYQSLMKSRTKEAVKLENLEKAISQLQIELDAMCEEAGCRAVEELVEAEKRSSLKLKITQQLKEIEEQLSSLSAGATIEEFIEEVRRIDSDSIDPMLSRLQEEIEDLTLQKSELDQTIGSERTELAKMDGSASAAELAEEAQGLLARLETDIEHFARLRLASVVLNQAIESYREKNQGPILKRANELFADMTLGSFEGLRVEINERGDAVLMGVRPGGSEIVGVEGMSDGTADQLYLAVRLASLETYLEKNEPMPFIVDDILIQFDDERAIATLQVLAELSRRTQIIFFTHHRHLVELAEQHVDQNVLFKHSLVA